MSHISTYAIKIQNINYFLNICENKGYSVIRGEQVVKQFGSNSVNCVGSVLIDGWRYPIAITSDGELKYDHFGSQLNTMELLGKTIQEYNDVSLNLEIPYDEISNCYKQFDKETGDIRVVLEY